MRVDDSATILLSIHGLRGEECLRLKILTVTLLEI